MGTTVYGTATKEVSVRNIHGTHVYKEYTYIRNTHDVARSGKRCFKGPASVWTLCLPDLLWQGI